MSVTPLMRSLVGQTAVSADLNILGTITRQFVANGKVFAVIDGDLEVDLSGCDQCLDVMGAWRQAHPGLPADFIRLAP